MYNRTLMSLVIVRPNPARNLRCSVGGWNTYESHIFGVISIVLQGCIPVKITSERVSVHRYVTESVPRMFCSAQLTVIQLIPVSRFNHNIYDTC